MVLMDQLTAAREKEVVTPASSTKVVYMKNVPKPVIWDTKDCKNIETFITEYETYCDALGYVDNDVRVRSFGSFLKEGAVATYLAWRGTHSEAMPWKALKEWAKVTWRIPHQYLLDASSLGAMKWKPDQSLARYAEEYKAEYLQYKCEENTQLGMKSAFLASLNETIRQKVWEREKLPETMLELLDTVICLGDVRELGK